MVTLNVSICLETSNANARKGKCNIECLFIFEIIDNMSSRYKHGSSFVDCVDIDECIERPHICEHGECKNLQGSFQCICDSGYYLSPSRDTCVDVDECTRHPNVCRNGTCVNMAGEYKCHCNPGFKLSPNNDCVDIDECHMMPFLCRNGRCRNTVGSFVCECATGYVLSADGHNCRDVDECREVQTSFQLKSSLTTFISDTWNLSFAWKVHERNGFLHLLLPCRIRTQPRLEYLRRHR